MGTTPDRRPGVADEEGTNYESTSVATAPGQVRYDGSRFSLYDATGEYDPRAGGGISEAQHKTLRQLIHFIDDGPADGFTSGAYKESVYTGAFLTQEIWWESASKLKKIVQLDATYTGAFPTTEVWQMFDTDGTTVLVTITDTITYSGSFEDTRTRTWA